MSEHKLSIIEKVQKFADLADGILEPIDENELAELSKDISNHGIKVYDYMKLVEKDSEELKEESERLAKAAKEQKNKAKSLRNYLADAMNKSGFTKMKFGRLSMSIQTRKKLIEKRPPTEKDFLANAYLVVPSYSWSRSPDATDKIKDGSLVSTDFSWDMAKIKELPSEDQAKYTETKSTLILTARVAKKD